ncbi:MAG: hypothetical protein OXG60_19545 [Chloroflexi bacterium]|nr:hypothetical protein [Chloroflexota bacterium]
MGEPDAQEDREKLQSCFVDTGDLDELRDVGSKKCIVLGRTGVGKTALLSMLEDKEEKVTLLSADDVAVDYLSNSVALKSYLDMGIELDLFFRVLWRHIFIKELIGLVGSRSGEPGINYFLEGIRNAVYKKPHLRKGQAYIKEHDGFWNHADIRVIDEIKRFEKQMDGKIEAKLGRNILNAGGGISTKSTLTQEEKSEIEKIGKEIVNRGQIRDLSNLMKLLAYELQKDRQKKYFIAIDGLDLDWTNDALRYKLIRALIEAARVLNNGIRQLKIVCAIREDLLDRVFRETRGHGDQQEKYLSLSLKLYWSDEQLEEVLERRINQLLVNHYAKGQRITLEDILSEKVRQRDPVSYIISRTLSTPRDVIMYLNACIEQAVGKSRINQLHIGRAEGVYSVLRLRALADEWSADFPTLGEAAFLLRGQNQEFRINSLDEERFINRIIEYFVKVEESSESDEILHLLDNYHEFKETMSKLFNIFYRIGIIGVHKEEFYETYWSHKGNRISASDITEETKLRIHPAFYRVLSIRH